jgi:hypothetical protein
MPSRTAACPTFGGLRVTRLRLVALALVASLVLVVAAGCGGDDDDSAGASPRSNGATATTTTAKDDGSSAANGSGGGLPQSEYVQRAQAACTKFEQKFAASLENFNPSSGDITEVAGKAADALHGIADELRGIGYPNGKQDAANKLYDAIDEAADQMQADPQRVVETEGNQIGVLAKDVGLESCGEL